MPNVNCIQSIQEVIELRTSLNEWRSCATRGRRIPEPLWEQARELAQRHGVAIVAKELGLGYYSLKKRVCGVPSGKLQSGESDTSFLELLPSILSGRALNRCTVELQSRRGPIKVDVGGLDVAGLVVLIRELAS